MNEISENVWFVVDATGVVASPAWFIEKHAQEFVKDVKKWDKRLVEPLKIIRFTRVK